MRMANIDDIFDDSVDDRSEEQTIFTQNWKRTVEPIKQEGYREGIAAGRDNTFQAGFDEGYASGFKTGLSIGHYNSVLKALASHTFNVPPNLDLGVTNLLPIDNPTRGLCILCTDSGKLLSKSEIESNIEKNSNVPLDKVKTKQEKFVEDVVNKKKLPEFNNVLVNLELETE